MLIPGLWLLCPDDIVRPVIRGEMTGTNGQCFEFPLLLDSGADRTVLTAQVLQASGLPVIHPPTPLSGIGGVAQHVLIEGTIVLRTNIGEAVNLNSQFAAFPSLDILDMSVLGRDITNLFAVIIDRPQDIICLLSQNHTYTIHER